VCEVHAPGTSADGDAVEICERTFAERPFVRPPEDVIGAGGEVTLYGAIPGLDGAARVVDRSGSAHLLVDEGGAPLSFPDGAAELPAELRMPSNRNLYMIYRFTGVAGTAVDPGSQQEVPSLHVTEARPVILIRGEAIDTALLGPWEGTVSARSGPDSWSEQDRVPVRITFTAVEPIEDMSEWDDPAVTLPDGERFTMVGTIENFTTPALASDGTCLPALSSLGQQNPYSGAAEGEVRMFRFPGMHLPGDHVLVLSYPPGTTGLGGDGMTGLRALHPAAFLQSAPSDDWTFLSIYPHGTPNGHRVDLRPVQGGGGGC
jgi:hypothetical protein